MTSPAHHEATKTAMKEAGCEQVSAFAIYDADCAVHVEGWDEDRDVCTVIDSAARIAYDLGRRDALNQAADAIEAYAKAIQGYPINSRMEYIVTGNEQAVSYLRSLLSGAKETDNGEKP